MLKSTLFSTTPQKNSPKLLQKHLPANVFAALQHHGYLEKPLQGFKTYMVEEGHGLSENDIMGEIIRIKSGMPSDVVILQKDYFNIEACNESGVTLFGGWYSMKLSEGTRAVRATFNFENGQLISKTGNNSAGATFDVTIAELPAAEQSEAIEKYNSEAIDWLKPCGEPILGDDLEAGFEYCSNFNAPQMLNSK